MQTLERPHSADGTRVFEPKMGAPKGTLIMIGGRAEEESLHSVVRELSQEKTLTIATIASKDREKENYEYYKEYFERLGFPTAHLSSQDTPTSYIHSEISGIFFTGGDQMRIMDGLHPWYREQLFKFYKQGGLIAGTSAGASVMGEIMPIRDSYASGLGVVPHIIDQHIQRSDRIGRMERLLEQFPDRVGVKIPENTALIYQDSTAHVMGEGTVYILAGQDVDVSESNFSNSYEIVLQEGEAVDLSWSPLRKQHI